MIKKDLITRIVTALKIVLPFLVLFFLYTRLYDKLDSFYTHFISFSIDITKGLVLLLLFFLMAINWLLESLKWQYLVNKITVISFSKSFKSIVNGLAFGLITPFKIGDIVTRVLHVNASERSKTYGSILVSRSSQLVATLFFGMLGVGYFAIFYLNMSPYYFSIVIIINALTISIYFNLKLLIPKLHKIKMISDYIHFIDVMYEYNHKEYGVVLFLSSVRYSVFICQYYLTFYFFNIEISFIDLAVCISIVFLIKSVIPLSILGGLGIREVAAISIFGFLGFDEPLILLITISIWVLNIIIPSLIGSFYSKNMNN